MPHCRIYLNEPLHALFNAGLEATIPAEQAHYLRHVMRLVSGDPITLFNGEGGEYRATIIQLSKQGGACEMEAYVDIDRELPTPVHIIQCANKSEKIETVIQKCTELGAASFQITNSERSQFKLPANKLDSRLERWRKIAIEAAEQSERTSIPAISWHASLHDIKISGIGYALHPETATQWRDAKAAIIAAEAITLAIGPEGGWSRKDLEALDKMGFGNLTFGARIMRTETAAPALVAAIQSILD